MSIYKKIGYYTKVLKEMYVTKRKIVSYMPEYIAVEVTNICNFKCAFCPQSDPAHHSYVPMSYLDEENCSLFLSKIRNAGIKTNLIHWTLDGEPFMHKDFHKLCWIGVQYGFTNAHFATNGMLCSADRLLQFPVNECRFNLAIDFCADREYFETVRGSANSWQRIKNNVVNIITDARFSNVYIELTDISSFSISNERDAQSRFEALKGLFRDCLDGHSRISYRTRTFHNATGFLSPVRKNKGRSYHLCPYPWTHLRVASNGDIVACCRDLRHKTVLGNLKTESVVGIWNGIPMQELRQALLAEQPEKIAACKGCDMPYDDSKFTLQNIGRAAKGRLQLFTSK